MERSVISDADELRRRKAVITGKITSLIPLMACLILAAVYFTVAVSNGYNIRIGMRVIISNATLVALVATGATFIFTSGSFDLSLGSNMLISALLGGLTCKYTGSLFLMFLVCVTVSVLLSVLNSTLASFFNLPVFIMTIVMMNVYGSVAVLLFTTLGENASVSVPINLVTPLNNTAFRLTLIISYELFCCFVFYILKTGRRQKFLGGNSVCAGLSGINGRRLTIVSFALAGIGIGLAAFSMVIETPTISSSSGSSVGMNMLIALVFGGMSMSGGPGSKMYSALLGALSMSFLDSIMNVFVDGSWYLQITKGVLFIAVVALFGIGKRSSLLER